MVLSSSNLSPFSSQTKAVTSTDSDTFASAEVASVCSMDTRVKIEPNLERIMTSTTNRVSTKETVSMTLSGGSPGFVPVKSTMSSVVVRPCQSWLHRWPW
ncbi:unnamed protein product [Pseudo-nitzschia multistriata]|uniref:Uncharacterized protein n=1 Tax=Pseudo-nitzschia multistriata TaxID=183589 RepID=A0A448ZE88_9STRA|nr:unnamed protein product [Pseudo-nitzschia multistriata]